MKKILSVLTIVALTIGIMACTRDNDVSVTGVSLNETAVTLIVGEYTTLVATVHPENATNSAVTWATSAGEIATVENGVVTAVSVGTATITVTTQDGNRTATAEITVNADGISVTGVSLNETAVTLTVGENTTLVATVYPYNATNRAVTWTTSAGGIATVDAYGVVTAIATGTATITVTTQNGNHAATAEITVDPVLVTGVSVQGHAIIIYREGTTLAATVYPANAANPAVTWTSSDETVATVENGVVTTVGGGTTIVFNEIRTVEITVTTECGGHSATTYITALPDRGCPRPGTGAFPETFVLGVPYFASDQTWTIPGSGDIPTQIWSDAVRAPFCNKDEFQGAMSGPGGAQRVDCRRSSNAFEGHFFSHCMMIRYANELCPYPWRIPFAEDFENLRDNLPGGTEALIGSAGTVEEPTLRGGIWGGTRFTGGFTAANALVAGQQSFYWSITEKGTATQAVRLNIGANSVNFAELANKNHGHAIRCVKNQ